MADFFHRLAARTLGVASSAEPRRLSRFDPGPDAGQGSGLPGERDEHAPSGPSDIEPGAVRDRGETTRALGGAGETRVTGRAARPGEPPGATPDAPTRARSEAPGRRTGGKRSRADADERRPQPESPAGAAPPRAAGPAPVRRPREVERAMPGARRIHAPAGEGSVEAAPTPGPVRIRPEPVRPGADAGSRVGGRGATRTAGEPGEISARRPSETAKGGGRGRVEERRSRRREPPDAREAPIHVSIGRVDVRAVPPAPPPARRQPTRPTPKLSLEKYLERRNEGRR